MRVISETEDVQAPAPVSAKSVRLDDQQRLAVTCDDSIPTLVLAGAGSGKTTVLTHRLVELIRRGVSPEGIVCCTFSRKAADELKERLAPLDPRAARANVNTIHGICLGILREEEIAKDVISGYEQKKILGEALKRLDWDVGWRYPLRWIDLAKSRMHSVDECYGFFVAELRQLVEEKDALFMADKVWRCYSDYEREKNAIGRIDFVDMLFMAWRLLRDPAVLRKWQSRVTHVLIDECVPGRTPVMLADGSSMIIREIVEKKLQVNVTSLDSQDWERGLAKGKPTFARVIGWHRLPLRKSVFRMVAKEFGRRCNLRTLVATEGHKVLTNRGWLPIEQVTTHDRVVVENAIINTEPLYRTFTDAYKFSATGRSRLVSSGGRRDCSGRRHGGPLALVRGGNGKGPTEPEAMLLDALGEPWEYNFSVAIGGRKNGLPTCFKIDVAHPGRRIAIEVDGQSHRLRKDQDERKEAWLVENGWRVYRFTNSEVIRGLDQVLQTITANSPVFADVLSVEVVEIKDDWVYDITVEGTHCYYANGVLVHNCQDTDALQMQILSQLAAPENRVFAVGDPDQSLYRWRSATPEINVYGFQETYPNGQVLRMETNYRSTKTIVHISNKAIAASYEDEDRKAFRKVLVPRPDAPVGDAPVVSGFLTPEEEADFVGQSIAELLGGGYRPGDVFVLYRTNAQSRPIEDQMISRSIPYVIAGGDGFYGRAVIKDVLAYLTMVENPHDNEAFKRVANIASADYRTHYRGFGAAFYGECEKGDLESLYRGMLAIRSWQPQFKQRAIDDLVGLLERVKVRGHGNPAETVIAIREMCYDSYLRRKEGLTADEELDSDESGTSDLEELVEAAVRFKSIESMLAYVRMVQGMQQMQQRGNGNAVVLSTVHKVKGLEKRVVFGIGIADGLLPHARALGYRAADELPFVNLSDVRDERCGMFVLVSRAKERLFLTWPETYRNRPMDPSRFLFEIGLVAQGQEPEAGGPSGEQPLADVAEPAPVLTEEYVAPAGMAW